MLDLIKTHIASTIYMLEVVQNTQQEKWAINCRSDGICPGGKRAGGTKCDTRDHKRFDSDYCGNCEFGYHGWFYWFNDYCCTKRESSKVNQQCKCLARDIPQCVGTRGGKLNFCCNIKINLYKYQLIHLI